LKTVAVRIVGSDSDPLEIYITPDMTVQDILTLTGLEHYVLSRRNEQNYLSSQEAIYDKLQDGEMLYASTFCTSDTCLGRYFSSEEHQV
jgi:hypothetical protein